MLVRQEIVTFIPADYEADETTTVVTLEDGETVLGVACRVLEAFDGTGAAVDLGDVTDPDGWGTTATIAPAATGLKRLSGAYVPGRAYAIAANSRKIDVDFTAGTSGTAGRVRFSFLIGKMEI